MCFYKTTTIYEDATRLASHPLLRNYLSSFFASDSFFETPLTFLKRQCCLNIDGAILDDKKRELSWKSVRTGDQYSKKVDFNCQYML